MKEGVSHMETQEKNQLGDGSDNYAGAAKQAANAAKSAKEAGKTAAKETAKKGAEATSRAAAATVKASVEGGKAAAQIAAGTAAMRDLAYFEMTRDKIIQTREWTKQELKRLGFVCGDSKSNFIFAMHPDVSGVALFEALREHDIFVRHFSNPARINEYLRITIGTDEQMKTFIAFLEDYLNKN